ncbi:MAG: excinuclease ABC subunit UvrA [Myxococcales bacterium]|nr:excinuclease ABC subunit UvrA [Myxococcales bacterium]
MAELDHIHIRGARQHNLKIDALSLPKKKLVVFTGPSGSGKSSLAFDTLYAEGQRRYVESLSSYARQFLGQMEKPVYEQLRGLSPTIAIEQKTASSNPRSTVGTITEIADYLRLLYARVGVAHCPTCGAPVEALSTDQIVERVARLRGQQLLLAPVVEHRKGEFRDLFEGLRQRGFVRARVDGEVKRLEDVTQLDKKRKHTIELVVDRLDPETSSRSRLADSVESALREGDGVLLVEGAGEGLSPARKDAREPRAQSLRLSGRRACLRCDIGLPELSPQSFSFNSPLGMCHSCNGLGRRMEIDPELVVPNPDLSINQGAIEPWANAVERQSGWVYRIIEALRDELGIDLDKPFKKLPKKQRELILRGTGERRVEVKWQGKHGSGKWAMRFEGVINTLMRRYKETSSEAMRKRYEAFFAEVDCSSCEGSRLRAESRAVTVGGSSIVDVTRLPVGEARAHFESLALEGSDAIVAVEVLKEIRGRLSFLCDVGLDYLALDRAGPSLSGGEAQRIRLASQLGSELSGVMYVLDEPSIGLHQRDNQRLIATLQRLRDVGNTVIVVEHDAETIGSADHVVDFGPGAGELGGEVVFSGSAARLRRSAGITGQYLSGKKRIEVPASRRSGAAKLEILGASENNLKDLDVALPLGTLVAVTGVSGAGKSSLVSSILYPALTRALHNSRRVVGKHRAIKGLDRIDKAIHIDQSPIGRTPRSNPATYTKCFDLIRGIFAHTPEARAYAFKPGRFSFNVKGGRCESCEGDGVKKVEMHFLPDVYVPCEVCRGQRYNEATLRVRFKGLNIAEVLGLSVREAQDVFANHPTLAHILETLADVGLDYIKLGQPAPTLSGGEAQRVKLSRELAKRSTGKTLYVLDEPTTGLHFEDIRKLLTVLTRLVDAGNTVVVIEHNLDVIKCADHVLDLGPEGGAGGGRIIAQGTPEQVAATRGSETGRFLAEVLAERSDAERSAKIASKNQRRRGLGGSKKKRATRKAAAKS